MIVSLFGFAPASQAATGSGRLRVAAERVSVFDGRVLLPVACAGGRPCAGRVGVGADGKRVAIGAGDGRLLRFAVPDRPRRVAVTFGSADGRRRTVRVPVRRGLDRERCGLGDFAEVVQRVGPNALLRLPYRRPDQTSIYLCARGVPRLLAAEGPLYFATEIGLTALSRHWGVVQVTDFGDDRQAVTTHYVCTYRIGGGPPTGYVVGDDTIAGLGVGDRGGVVLGVRTGEEDPAVVVVDSGGRRAVDQGPDVDPQSVLASGNLASWTTLGMTRTAPLGGPADPGDVPVDSGPCRP